MDENAIKKFQGENAEEIPEVEEAINEYAGAGEHGTMQSPDASQGQMTVDTLPQDVREALPEDAQQVFIAAYNSIYENNGDRDSAMKVAWQSIEHSEIYTRGADGKFIRKPMEQGLHRPQPLSES
ncbi:MAG: ChaB family protein [Oscillatoriales cyanobacterium C42_A2020_001]|nr:ChaB family protein [Leptolyngbyaceae cyanobacterium C42_A2020_001]